MAYSEKVKAKKENFFAFGQATVKQVAEQQPVVCEGEVGAERKKEKQGRLVFNDIMKLDSLEDGTTHSQQSSKVFPWAIRTDE